MIKTIKWIVAGVIVAGVVYIGLGMNRTYEYTAPGVIEKEVEIIKEVNPLEGQYEKREMELAEKYRKIQSIEARIDVNQAEIERLQAQVKADRAELSSFMTATASGN